MDATLDAEVNGPTGALQTPEDVPNAETKADLGILLVHGIGEQAQGETLLQFAEPIIEWIRIWLRQDLSHKKASKGTLFISQPFSAQLKPPLLETGTPAHTRAVIGTLDKKGDGQAEEWLFAEAWWGHQVYPPAIAGFTVWLLTRGPWIMLFHFYQGWIFVKKSKAEKMVYGIIVTLVWLLLSLSFNIFLLAVSLVALLPIGWVRRVVYGFLRKITGVLGDAYVQIRSPIQEAAFADATLKAMRWLRPRCKRLAIVAHSQGAAIAVNALRQADAPQADRLITVGAGITKLEALRFFEEQDATYRVSAMLASPFVLLACMAWLRTRQLGLDELSTGLLGPLLLSLIGVQFLANAWIPVFRAFEHLKSLPLALKPALHWCDIVATRDPVPVGNLKIFFSKLEAVESKALTVFNSIFNDHTHYWQARATFLPAIVSQLGQTSEAKNFALDTGDSRFEMAAKGYKLDLFVLRVSKWADVIAFLALPLYFSHKLLSEMADAAREGLVISKGSSAPFAFIAETLNKIEDGMRWITMDVADATWPHTLINTALAFSVLAFMLWLWRKIIFGLWQTWSANRIDGIFGTQLSAAKPVAAQRKTQEMIVGKATLVKENIGPLILKFGFMFILMLPLLLSSIGYLYPGSMNEKNLYYFVGFVATMLVALIMMLGLLTHFLDEIIKVIKFFEDPFKPGSPRGWALVEVLKIKIVLILYMIGVASIMISVLVLQQYTHFITMIVFSAFMIVVYLLMLLYFVERLWHRLEIEKKQAWTWPICGSTMIITSMITIFIRWQDANPTAFRLAVYFAIIWLLLLGVALVLLKWSQGRGQKNVHNNIT